MSRGRREKQIDSARGAAAEFALALRAERNRCGLTYRQMAQAAHYSASALSRAANGRGLPSWTATRAYLLACGNADLDAWKSRWSDARLTIRLEQLKAGRPPATRTPASHLREFNPVGLAGVDRPTADLLKILHDLRLSKGMSLQRVADSSAAIQQAAAEDGREIGRLSSTKIHEVEAGRRPVDDEFIELFVLAVGADSDEQHRVGVANGYRRRYLERRPTSGPEQAAAACRAVGRAPVSAGRPIAVGHPIGGSRPGPVGRPMAGDAPAERAPVGQVAIGRAPVAGARGAAIGRASVGQVAVGRAPVGPHTAAVGPHTAAVGRTIPVGPHMAGVSAAAVGTDSLTGTRVVAVGRATVNPAGIAPPVSLARSWLTDSYIGEVPAVPIAPPPRRPRRTPAVRSHRSPIGYHAPRMPKLPRSRLSALRPVLGGSAGLLTISGSGILAGGLPPLRLAAVSVDLRALTGAFLVLAGLMLLVLTIGLGYLLWVNRSTAAGGHRLPQTWRDPLFEPEMTG